MQVKMKLLHFITFYTDGWSKKLKKDTAKITQLMETTFPFRRKKILEEKMLIQDIKKRYPALFTSTEVRL